MCNETNLGTSSSHHSHFSKTAHGEDPSAVSIVVLGTESDFVI
jgi:hypothetical protein